MNFHCCPKQDNKPLKWHKVILAFIEKHSTNTQYVMMSRWLLTQEYEECPRSTYLQISSATVTRAAPARSIFGFIERSVEECEVWEARVKWWVICMHRCTSLLMTVDWYLWVWKRLLSHDMDVAASALCINQPSCTLPSWEWSWQFSRIYRAYATLRYNWQDFLLDN